MFTLYVYETLGRLGLTKNQYDFSVNWLGRGKSYMGAIKAAGREASPSALATAYFRLDAFIRHLERSEQVRGYAALPHALRRAKVLHGLLRDYLGDQLA